MPQLKIIKTTAFLLAFIKNRDFFKNAFPIFFIDLSQTVITTKHFHLKSNFEP